MAEAYPYHSWYCRIVFLTVDGIPGHCRGYLWQGKVHSQLYGPEVHMPPRVIVRHVTHLSLLIGGNNLTFLTHTYTLSQR